MSQSNLLKAASEGTAGLDAVYSSIEQYWNETTNFSFNAKAPIVRLHEPSFGPEEIMEAVKCMLQTKVTMGEKVKSFEHLYASHFGHKYGVMNNSGSSANLLAVAALSNPVTRDYLRPGDEVIVPALAWSTTVWPLIQCNLTPVVVDIDPKTLNIDPNEIEKAIGPKTRAVMIVPVYGNPCDMDAIVDICKRHNLLLIEDCCESMGATYKGKSVGSFGSVGTFSFYYSHHITTLEGGITVTDDSDIDDLLRILRAHGWTRETKDPQKYLKQYPGFDPRFVFVNVGYNLRPTELQGAMGHVQLPKLKGFIETRRDNAHYWLNEFAEFRDLMTFQDTTEGATHSWFGFSTTLSSKAPFSVNEIRGHLEAAGIETRPIICGNIAAHPAMKLYPHRVSGDLKYSSAVMKNGFSFGNHHFVCPEARSHISRNFKEFMKKFS
ncbi:MAG: DegT/DnrJ/EryC1/StrS family aminotransferase [Alphaproteobacteria bacterium]|nr:DegT/DnrJ/EryC1/StrS family aminotransferase [Alphaproteobacteria bacterium]